TFETSTMLFGFVGLTAIASSDSFVCRWLMSTFVGIDGAAGRCAWPEAAKRNARQSVKQNATASRLGRMVSPSPVLQQSPEATSERRVWLELLGRRLVGRVARLVRVAGGHGDLLRRHLARDERDVDLVRGLAVVVPLAPDEDRRARLEL